MSCTRRCKEALAATSSGDEGSFRRIADTGEVRAARQFRGEREVRRPERTIGEEVLERQQVVGGDVQETGSPCGERPQRTSQGADALREIVRGEVASGDAVVVQGQSRLSDGSMVTVRNRETKLLSPDSAGER